MTEDELIHLLRELDRPLEPSGTFRDDLLARLRSEREHSHVSRVSGMAGRSDRYESDAAEIWASPAPKPRRGQLMWAVAAFATILAAGAVTWWLAPGPTSQPPTATSPTPTSVPGTSVPAEGESAGVVEVRSPGTDDYQLLQQVIDGNPDAVLQLQAGTYELGGQTLAIPHGVTIRGASGPSEARHTIIAGQLQIQAISPDHAGEEVVLSDLEIESTDPDHAAILYGDHAGATLDRGGADLTIDNVLIRQTGGYALDIHAQGIDVTITSSVVSSTDGWAIYVFDRGDNTIEIRNNTVEFAHYGIVVLGDENETTSTNTTTHIIGNDIRGGPVPSPENFSGGVSGLIVSNSGELAVSDNTVEIPHGNSDLLDPALGMAIYGNWPQRNAEVTDNRLIGGDLAEETTLRVGIRVESIGGTYARNTLEGSWATGVMVYTSGNVFENNSLRNVNLTPQPGDSLRSRVPSGQPDQLPAVHWWLGAGASENIITENTFEELLIVDRGEENSYPESFELVEP